MSCVPGLTNWNSRLRILLGWKGRQRCHKSVTVKNSHLPICTQITKLCVSLPLLSNNFGHVNRKCGAIIVHSFLKAVFQASCNCCWLGFPSRDLWHISRRDLANMILTAAKQMLLIYQMDFAPWCRGKKSSAARASTTGCRVQCRCPFVCLLGKNEHSAGIWWKPV